MDDVSPLDQQTLAVYRAILFHKQHDPDKLAELLDIGSDDVHAALTRLSDLSLLAPSGDSPGSLRAVNPSLGLKVSSGNRTNWSGGSSASSRTGRHSPRSPPSTRRRADPARTAPSSSTTSTRSASGWRPSPSRASRSPSSSTPSAG
ncbi:hypothetical protein ACF09Y_15720 [Streptomyces massasporeus]|uniref:hypothetical protein n=1 Tax=Streptomyces massasporeus TaxID=67324 RepID=UPI0036FA34EB